ncbi:uncharacterized protein TNCV_4388051 [Trichonephila clavipes]|nr:uncharacterized protein TNCV_4388051 [Trichonephila clavipes]
MAGSFVVVARPHWSAVLDQALEDSSRRGRLRRTVRAHFKALASFGKFHCFDMAISKAATRGLLATDHVIFNHGQVTWTTPELAPPLLTTTPHQREDVSALDRFNVHRCPTRRVFSGTGLEPVTKQATVRYLYHSATAATHTYEIATLRISLRSEP